MNNKIFCINRSDNVGTLLLNVKSGKHTIFGETSLETIDVLEYIKNGHKVAINIIKSGASVVKYGVVIGQATKDIKIGEWVHLHNMKSCFDERSSSLDRETGLARDIEYE